MMGPLKHVDSSTPSDFAMQRDLERRIDTAINLKRKEVFYALTVDLDLNRSRLLNFRILARSYHHAP